MRYPFKFDSDKAIEVILYIAKRLQDPDLYHIGKILYFADLEHLKQYGRFVCGDTYVAMKDGPVPSGTYDIIKYVRGDGFYRVNEYAKIAFEVHQEFKILPNKEPDLSVFSDSEIECLDKSIKQYGHLSFSKLKQKSHDEIWESADPNGFIDMDKILEHLPDGESLREHLQEPHPG